MMLSGANLLPSGILTGITGGQHLILTGYHVQHINIVVPSKYIVLLLSGQQLLDGVVHNRTKGCHGTSFAKKRVS